MKRNHFWGLTILVSIVFTILFYKNNIGINLLIFEWCMIPIMFYVNRPIKYNTLSITLLISLALSSLMVVIIHTSWTIFINFLLLVSTSGVLSLKEFRSFIHSLPDSIFRIFSTHFSKQKFLNQDGNNSSFNSIIKKIFLFGIVPLSITLFFFLMYVLASSKFAEQISPFFDSLYKTLFKFNFTIILYMILGFLVSNILIRNSKSCGLLDLDLASSNKLFRQRIIHTFSFKINGLKYLCLVGIITLSILNVLIFSFNISDIKYVWFYSWDGSFLKEFIHQGTWILIFSIILSGIIALFFFKDNLNFYYKNKWIKRLTITWLAQNILMTISVGIRNYWYLTYFGLAYKRIAVFFFLALAIIALVTIIIKIYQKKSFYYLLKINSYTLLVVLIISSFIDWNTIIAKYNFKNANKSFIEYKFITELENSALPYSIKTIEELDKIDSLQVINMPFNTKQDFFWDSKTYYKKINSKKNKFLKEYSEKKTLEWNLSDYLTYKKLRR